QLPVYERIGDARGQSATLFKIATALLGPGGLEAGRAQEIYDALAESYAIVLKLGHPDGVGPVGALLAQVLALAAVATTRSPCWTSPRRLSPNSATRE